MPDTKRNISEAEWAAFADSGVEAVVGKLQHRPTGRTVPAVLCCNLPPSGDPIRDELCEIEISEERILFRVRSGLPFSYSSRIKALLLRILLPYLQDAVLKGRCAASLGDEGLSEDVLSFSSSSPGFLIPDPDFINSRGYASHRAPFAAAPAWEERLDTLYWRGADTGVWRYTRMEEAPRLAICRLAKAHPGVIDAAITRIEPRPYWEAMRAFYTAKGYFGLEEDQAQILRYRYQMDIDGNSNAWAGLFLKLLSGSPVLKAASAFGFRQWYYDALRPWVNFVPVKADLSDLHEVLSWLRAYPVEARRIGANGAALAQGMTMASELPKAFQTVDRLLARNRKDRSG